MKKRPIVLQSPPCGDRGLGSDPTGKEYPQCSFSHVVRGVEQDVGGHLCPPLMAAPFVKDDMPLES